MGIKPRLSLLIAAIPFMVHGTLPAFASGVTRPKLGSAARTALLDALREDTAIQRLKNEWKVPKIVFYKVRNYEKNDWAYVSANPGTADQKHQLDPVNGVLRRVNSKWELVSYVSDEVASSEDPNAAFKKWCDDFVKAHTGCPRDLFPTNF